jgi:hypothetical protein
VVVEPNPVANDSAGVLQGLESVAMHALVFERADDPLHHAVLLWAVGGDELLLQTVALDQRSVAAACEDPNLGHNCPRVVGFPIRQIYGQRNDTILNL